MTGVFPAAFPKQIFVAAGTNASPYSATANIISRFRLVYLSRCTRPAREALNARVAGPSTINQQTPSAPINKPATSSVARWLGNSLFPHHGSTALTQPRSSSIPPLPRSAPPSSWASKKMYDRPGTKSDHLRSLLYQFFHSPVLRPRDQQYKGPRYPQGFMSCELEGVIQRGLPRLNSERLRMNDRPANLRFLR